MSIEEVLLQRGEETPEENKKAFDQAASDYAGVDLRGAADAVIQDKERMGGFFEAVEAQFRGVEAIRDPNVEVKEQKAEKSLFPGWDWIATPTGWSKKFPGVHKIVKQGIRAEKDMSRYIQRFDSQWGEAIQDLTEAEYAHLIDVSFLADADDVVFTDSELDQLEASEATRQSLSRNHKIIREDWSAYRSAQSFNDD